MDMFSEENTYFLDPDAVLETVRLVDQQQWLTHHLGGLFPEGTDLSHVDNILDLACGPGGWVLDVAHTYPAIHVVGIDNTHSAIRYARAYAQVRKIKNASFRLMNILHPLDFPDASFDLINARLLFGCMPKLAWVPLLQECQRILRPGGIMRLTEGEWGMTTSPAMQQVGKLLARALVQGGYSGTAGGEHGMITPLLPSLLRKTGYSFIQHTAHAIDYSAGTQAHSSNLEDFLMFCTLVQPFICRWTETALEDFEHLCQQARVDILSDDFCGLRYFLTAWGYKQTPL